MFCALNTCGKKVAENIEVFIDLQIFKSVRLFKLLE
jgi:hypothetical protein